MRSRMSFIACLMTVALAFSAARGQEWTRFRGPDGTGIGRGASIPTSFADDGYRWKVKLPAPGHSSPVLWGERIFLTCAPPSGPGRQVVCLHADDGRILWSWKDTFRPYNQNRLNSFAASTPAVDAERVYLSWVSGAAFEAVALNHDGKLLWRRKVDDFKARHGAGASAIVLDGVVIAGNTHIGESSFMIGLDAATGEVRWKRDCKSGPTSYITPGIYRPPGGEVEVLFVSSSHGVTSLDPSTGRLNWEAGGPFQLKSVASPNVAGSLVFASAGQGGSARQSAVVRPGRGDTKADVAYRLGEFAPYVPTPIAVGEHLFVLHDRGRLTCVEPATGKVLGEQKFSGTFYPSPVSVNGRIYCINTKGEVTVVSADPQCKVIATSQLPEGTHATPAIAHGRMYLRTYNHLLCAPGKP